MLIETHAHLDYPDFASDLDDVLRRANDAGVTRIVTIGTSVESSRRAIDLAEKHPGVFAAIGVHRNCYFQKRRGRARSCDTNPALEIHGGNRLPLSGARSFSRKTLGTGLYTDCGGNDRSSAKGSAERSCRGDNRNRGRIFSVQSDMNINNGRAGTVEAAVSAALVKVAGDTP